MRHVTLHQLKVFEVAARHHSFTRAAEEMFLTQPTVSMQIKQLTKLVGIPLFEQVGKKLFLTEAGENLYLTCQEMFKQLDQFEMTVADMKGLKQGNLRLAVVTTAKYVVPRLLGLFCQRYPGIEVSLNVANHDRLIERLSENRDDIYIMSQLPHSPEVNAIPFLENPLVVLASRNHPLVEQTRIPLSRIVQEPFIVRETGSGTRRTVQKLLDQHNLNIQIKMELASNEAIKQAVAGGLGISILSRHTINLEGASGQIAILDVQEFPILNQWYMATLAGKQLSIVTQTFLDYLQNEGKQIAAETMHWK